MQSTYKSEDVVLLLKDLTGQIKPQSTKEREKLIQSGKHYSEMLPIEYVPTDQYTNVYKSLCDVFAQVNANAVATVSRMLFLERGKDLVLVSLARAGTSVGILIKHYLERTYGINVPHYSISIIRGKGIDTNALNTIMMEYCGKNIVFVDGWTGKGAIKSQLVEALKAVHCVKPTLAVLADPAGVADYWGTRRDILIPSCCLNCTVSGLISRTVLRDDLLGPKDYHGAVYYRDMRRWDVTYDLINKIESKFSTSDILDDDEIFSDTGLDEAKRIADKYGITDINLVKPSLGETTRVLLRRVPDRVLIANKYRNTAEVTHIVLLANERGVPVEYVDLEHYAAVGLIKQLSDV